MELLQEMGEIKDFEAKNIDGKTMTKALTLGRVSVFSHEKMACQPEYSKTLEEYIEKFINQDDFRHVIIKNVRSCNGWGESYLADQSNNMDLFFQLNKLIPTSKLSSSVVLVDRQGQIRSVYDLTKKDDVESLVTHTTLLMPPLKKRG